MHSVIFDVDGTLWDSTDVAALAWQDTAKRCGVSGDHITGSRLKEEFGKLLPDIGISLFPDLPKDTAVTIAKKACDIENEYLRKYPVKVYPEVPELLCRLKEENVPVCIVSNCQTGYIEVLLETNGLMPYVCGFLSAGGTQLPKADNIRLAAEKWQLPSPVYVGDTFGDYCATKEAGLPFIFASYGFGSVPSPDGVIRSPLELPEVLRQLQHGC